MPLTLYRKPNVSYNEYKMQKYIYNLNIVNVPRVISYDKLKCELTMEKIEGSNLSDFYGNTPLHYIFSDKRIDYLEFLFTKSDIKFNSSNINGDVPLHILLESEVLIDNIKESIINKIILETDLNIQNNQGITCLMLIIKKKLVSKFRSLLILKPLNFFIEDNDFNHIQISDDILEVLIESYYNKIKIKKEELLEDWEKYCSEDLFEKLKKIIVDKSGAKNSESLCKSKIKDVILNVIIISLRIQQIF
jgi:hypothetical protein